MKKEDIIFYVAFGLSAIVTILSVVYVISIIWTFLGPIFAGAAGAVLVFNALFALALCRISKEN